MEAVVFTNIYFSQHALFWKFRNFQSRDALQPIARDWKPLTDYNVSYNPWKIFTRARLVNTRYVTDYPPAKSRKYPSDISQNIWRITNTKSSIWLWKCARAQCICPWTLSVPQSSQFSPISSLGKMLSSRPYNVWGHAHRHIFALNGGYCLYS